MPTFAQNCNCMEEYKWVKKTFEENDAGYPYYIEKYGKLAIELNNKKWEKEFIKTKDVFQCLTSLNNWIKFYRKGHLIVCLEDQTKSPPINAKQPIFPAIENNLAFNISTFKDYANSLPPNSMEGVWSNGIYEIAIKKINEEYIGFIINSKNPTWKQGEIKFRFPINQKLIERSAFYMGDHTPANKRFDSCKIIGSNYLKAFEIYWKRVAPAIKADDQLEIEISALSAKNPFITKINEQTVLMRIPSFDDSYIKTVDSIVKSNQTLLTSTKNLIIDIRGNGGGADRCFQAITPYLYTNPIRTMWIDFLSTPLNNARYDWIVKIDGFTEKEKQEFRDVKKKLDANIGNYVNLNDGGLTYSMDTLPTTFENPKKIAVLIDNANASTAEQFILMAKQSQKVKLFGKRTYGALDFSNLNYVTCPSKNFKLAYTTSRSYRMPEMAIDDYGIQPDYYFDNSIPEYEWIKEALKILN